MTSSPLAHIVGIPFEEVLLPVLSSGGAVWLAVRGRLPRRPRPRRKTTTPTPGGPR